MKPPADVILVNADIRTMDPAVPRATALAVRDGRICALDTTGDLSALHGDATRIVDVEGRPVLPGFQDTHIHLQDSGREYALSVRFDEAELLAEIQDTLRDFAARHPEHEWIRGGGWNAGIFGEHNLDRRVLDAAVPDRPVFLRDSNGHSAVINSRACDLLGLDAATPDPVNGRFVRAPDGTPSGMLHEDALDWARARMPTTPDRDFAEGVRWAQRQCNAHGITGVLDASVAERHQRVYRALDSAGELTLRVCATAKVLPEETTAGALARIEALRRDYCSPTFRIHSAKFFVDGIIENRTAAMIEDYSDELGGNAALMFDEAHLRELFIAFDAARFQIHVHVIGDRAARAAFDALAAAREANGAWPSLHQLAHLQCIDPADIPRFGELGVVANMQPLWARNEPSVTDIAVPMVGPRRARWIYAFKSMIEAGAPYALSSDWGVSTLNPFQIIQTAICRQAPHRGRDHPPFFPEERLDLAAAVRGYTVNAAAAAWRGQDTGSLSPGKLADLIVLDRDIFAIDPYEIGETKVLLTLLGGREVYRA